jgi:hypothetical protein
MMYYFLVHTNGVIGWWWCAIVFVFLAIRLRRRPGGDKHTSDRSSFR